MRLYAQLLRVAVVASLLLAVVGRAANAGPLDGAEAALEAIILLPFSFFARLPN